MAKIKLAALDVDGTLVRRDLSLSPAVVKAVESLRDAGIIVSINTGRSMGELIDFRRSFPWIRYFVVSNGDKAVLTSGATEVLPLLSAFARNFAQGLMGSSGMP